MIAKEILGGPEAGSEESPESFTADLAALTRETENGSLRLFVDGPANFSLETEPIAHGADLTERNSGLSHAERSGIHAKKEDALFPLTVATQI